MTSYYHWTSQADRYAKSVDYGSPLSAWTSDMWKALEECDGDKVKATALLRERREK